MTRPLNEAQRTVPSFCKIRYSSSNRVRLLILSQIAASHAAKSSGWIYCLGTSMATPFSASSLLRLKSSPKRSSAVNKFCLISQSQIPKLCDASSAKRLRDSARLAISSACLRSVTSRVEPAMASTFPSSPITGTNM